jgi:Cu+-exporting ATPase
MSVANPPPTDSLLKVAGLNCNNCVRRVSDVIQGFSGVASVSVSLESQQATIRWTAGSQPDLALLLTELKKAGYPSRVSTKAGTRPAPRLGGWAVNLAVGIPVTMVLMLGEWFLPLAGVRWFDWVSFALAGLVQAVAGARFYRGAWAQFKARSSNMDTLVALGSTTAFGYSTWALLAAWPGHLYFMEAAAIITLISLGHWIESRVSEKAEGSLKALMTLAPQTARKLTGANLEVEVPVADLQASDVVALRPGDRVPVDGEVIDGTSVLDEAMLTGEAAPVEKSVGSALYAGTTNHNSRLVMRVTATGESTALAHIIAAVQRAQASRADIQRLGDSVSNVFVPIVCLVALATAMWWGLAYEQARQLTSALAPFLWHAHPPATPLAAAVIAAAAVLIVACPCAMGLATPAAIMAAANAAARRGILIRDGVALEKAGRITAVMFDKTGTLTSGRPVVARAWAGNSAHASGLAATLAKDSTHPVSQALARHAAPDATVADWSEIRGAGVRATVKTGSGNSGAARLGSLRWLEETGAALLPGDAFVKEWAGQGATVVGLAIDRELLGLFAVQDALKPGAELVVRRLQDRGLDTLLVTGDNPATAMAIAKKAGIAPEKVYAGVRPEEKAGLVQKLQTGGARVGFVGDGINDAPALTQADLGVAVGRASDVAREAADILLLKSEIEAVPESLGLAQATLQTIRQNLFWAFFYNAAAVPLAALGFMSPVLCAAAMGLSDVIVIGNALRLLRWKLRD